MTVRHVLSRGQLMVQRAMAIESRKENVQARRSCTTRCSQRRRTVSRKLLFDQVLHLYHSEIYHTSGMWYVIPSVLWCCWKGIQPVQNWVLGCWHGYLSGLNTDLHITQLISLPLTVSCSSKSRLVLPFWYWLTRVALDKGPLNCSSSCSTCSSCSCSYSS